MNNWKKWLGLVLILLLALGVCGCSNSKDAAESYADAQQLLAEGRYADGAAAFASLGSYEESSRLSMYAQAHAEAERGNYSLAAASMEALGDFRDAELQAVYYRAQQLLKNGPVDTSCYSEAGELLAQLGVFRKSHQVNVQEVAYQDGLRLLDDEYYDQAVNIFSYLRYYNYDYKDSRQLYFYTLARQNEALGALVYAVDGYADLNGFRDSDKRMKKCADAAYQELQSFVDAGDLKSARTQLNNMLRNSHFSGYEDLAQLDIYLSARELEKSGGADIDSYTRAAALYAGLGDFRDSAKRAKSIPQSIYDNAMAALEQGDYKTAATLFSHQKDYRDSRTMIDYTEACRLQSVAVGERDQLKSAVERNKATWSDLNELWDAVKAAGDAFTALGDFRDSADRAKDTLNLLYDYAMSVGEQKQYALAGNILSVATGQTKWQAQSNYFFGMHCLAEANEENNAASLIDARYYFLLAGDFSDAAAQAAGCVDKLYAMGDAALAAGDYAGASNAYKLIPESKDADALIRYVANRELEAKGATAPENYARAAEAYEKEPDVRDSAERAAACRETLFQLAETAFADGNHAGASVLYGYQPEYKDGRNRSAYAAAMAKKMAVPAMPEQYIAAAEAFTALGKYSDAADQAKDCIDQLRAMGDAALAAGRYADASNAYALLPDPHEAAALTGYTVNRNTEMKAATNPKNYVMAAEAYEKASDVRDSAERAAACRETLFQLAETAYAEGRYGDASVLYGYQPEYKDGQNRSGYAAAMAEKMAVPVDPAQYVRASNAFAALGEYSDAAAQAKDCIDQLRAMGDADLAAGRYVDAYNTYALLPDPHEAAALTGYTVNRNTEMEAATNPKNYVMAAEAYEKASDVRDSAERAAACRETLFQLAETAYAEGRYDDASVLYSYQPAYQEGQNRSVYASAMAREAAAKADATQYAAAADIYETLGDYSDAAQRAADCRETLFQMAETALAEGRYTDAAAFYSSQPTYNTADKQVEYVSALALESEGKNDVKSYLKAAEAFDAMDGFRDTADRAEACRKAYYDHAAALVEAGEYAAAAECLTALGEYSDAPVLCKYSKARALMDKQMNEQALPLLTELGDYRDSAVLLGQVQDTLYQGALKLFASAEFIAAANQFRLLGDYKDAVAFAYYAEGLEAEAAWLAGKENRLEDAKAAFAAAGDFKDAAERLRKVTGYADGLVKYRAGDWEAAAAAFEQVSDYQQAGQLAIYSSALANEAKGDAGDVNGYIAAADLYESLGNYQDASKRAVRLRNKLNILFADQVRAESEGIRAVKRNGKWGFANDKDELISDFQWDECRDFAEGFAAVKKDGKWGFIRANGTVLCKPTYSSVYDFREGRACVYNGSYYDYLKTNGKLLLNSTRYTKATPFSQGRAMVYDDSRYCDYWCIIDVNGQVLKREYLYINEMRHYIRGSGQFANGFARIPVNTSSYSSSGNKNVYINLDCEYVSNTEPVAEGNYWKINNNGGDAYMNQKGTIVTYASQLDFNDEGYCITTENGLKGMIHKDGRTITENLWNIIHHFSNDRALVKKGNYYGFIDRNGKVAITCQYNDAHDFSDGLALVKLNGMCGFINVKGELVVPLVYDDATDFADGQARVQRYGQWTVIDTSGKPVK